MTNTDKFLNLYSELDNLLRIRYKENNRSNSVITRFISELTKSGVNELIEDGRKLNMFRILRNDLVHELDLNKSNIIEINNSTIHELEDIVEYLRNPKRAKDLYTPLKNLSCLVYEKDYDLNKVVDLMRRKGFTQVPVLDNQDVVKGVFSPNVLFDYLNIHNNKSLNDLSFKDIKEYTLINKHFSEAYDFASINDSVEEINELFSAAHKQNRKLVMLFITQFGKSDEPLKGIIVLRDLLKETPSVYKNR